MTQCVATAVVWSGQIGKCSNHLKVSLKRLPQLGFEPRTDHLHNDCSTLELPSYLQRRITLPLIYFEIGVLTHYQGRRDYILVSKHLSIEGAHEVALILLHCSQIRYVQATRSFPTAFQQIVRLFGRQDFSKFYR